VVAGSTQQFAATGTFSGGTTYDVTRSVSWISTKTTVATVSNTAGTQGLATGVTAGSASIRATSNKITGSTLLTVTVPVTLVSITVTPALASIPLGTQQQYTATGNYSDGSTQNLTGSVMWSSSVLGVATISAGGLSNSVAVGTTAVSASSGTIVGSTTLTVNRPALVSIALTPVTPAIAVGQQQQFVATGTYTDGSMQNLTGSAIWSSSVTGVATVNAGGVASGISAGTTTISAVSGSISGATTLTVNPAALVSIVLTPASAVLSRNAQQQFTATGTYSDGSKQDVTNSAAWISSVPGTASVISSGVVNGSSTGKSTIAATVGSVSGTAAMTVTQASLVSIAVTPTNPSFASGTVEQLSARGIYSDGSTMDLTSSVSWVSGDLTIATVDAQGLATAVAVGSTTITASMNGVSGTTAANVTSASPISIAVTPAVATVSPGSSEQFTATATFNDGSIQDVTQVAQWSSSITSVASFSGSQGIATGTASGTTAITAAFGGASGSTTLTVSSASLVSIAVTPGSVSVAPGITQQLVATGTFSDGTTQDLTARANWSSSATGAAIVTSPGVLTAIESGTANVTASSGSVTGTAVANVTSATLNSVAIGPQSVSTAVPGIQPFTATGTFSDGTNQDVTGLGYWTSSNAAVATVGDSAGTSGVTTALSAGTTSIGVSCGAINSAASLTVSFATLASIAISPQSPSIAVGATQQFTATGTYSDGSSGNLTASVTWNSSAAGVAVISNQAGSSGLATSSGGGSTTITGSSGPVSASTTLSVSAAMVGFSPGSLNFGLQAVGVSSVPQTITLTNTGNATLQITSIAITGSFSETNTCGTSLNAGTSCSISVAFTPSIAGGASGNVVVTDNAGSSPQTVTLSGTGDTLSFQHIIVVVQENRSPDNLFQGLCSPPFGTADSCSTNPAGSQYNIQTSDWLDKTSATGVTQPTAIGLQNGYDPSHNHPAFNAMCDMNAQGVCRMDGAALDGCTGGCPAGAQLAYVENSDSTMDPYLTMVTQYGWANYFFQTNQGASFPAHQFLFGGTSAPSADDDAIGTFIAENVNPNTAAAGCIALAGTISALITPAGERGYIYPCTDHQTMADLLDSINVSWKYYTISTGSIWTAPNAVEHICVPSAPTGGTCTGPDWTNNVVLNNPAQILTDISSCHLSQVSWVIPTGGNSDHPSSNTGGGPSWVASIVNAIGANPQCGNGETYWNNTAILVTWDDWGGWYDHVPPVILAGVQGDYQYGFRVPFFFVSAYTPAGYVDNNVLDFGSTLRFIEHNFGIAEGALNFADARATNDLGGFYNLSQVPRPFQTVPARYDAKHFIEDKTPPTPPDED
jgi:phospholipase C